MLTLILGLILLIFFLWFDCSPPTDFPPGPKWYPLLGNIPQVVKKLSIRRFHHLVWDDMAKIYGPVVGLKLGRHKIVLVSSKDLIKEVCSRDEFDGRPKGFFWEMRARGGRLGVVFNDGIVWKEHRRFSVQHLKKVGFGGDVMEDLIIEEATEMVKWLKSLANTPVYMSEVFNISALNVIWAFIAGKRYHREDEALKKVCHAIHECFRIIDASGGLLQQIPIIRFVIPNGSGYNALNKHLNTTWNFLIDTLNEHKKTLHPKINRDFIDAFLNKMNTITEKDSSFTEDQLLVLCLDFLQAGTDTTSNTLSFLILYMIHHQDVQKKVRQEIDDIIGRIRKPKLDDRHSMPYVSAVMMEVQRMANIAPAGVPHRVLKTTQLNGYTIPEDTTVLLLLYNLHVDEYWKDPFTFRPERFLDERGNILNTDWFSAFGYGKRKCIGENLAKGTIFLFCTFLFQNFNVRTDTEIGFDPVRDVDDGISLTPKPYKAIWTLRD